MDELEPEFLSSLPTATTSFGGIGQTFGFGDQFPRSSHEKRPSDTAKLPQDDGMGGKEAWDLYEKLHDKLLAEHRAAVRSTTRDRSGQADIIGVIERLVVETYELLRILAQNPGHGLVHARPEERNGDFEDIYRLRMHSLLQRRHSRRLGRMQVSRESTFDRPQEPVSRTRLDPSGRPAGEHVAYRRRKSTQGLRGTTGEESVSFSGEFGGVQLN